MDEDIDYSLRDQGELSSAGMLRDTILHLTRKNSSSQSNKKVQNEKRSGR